jgi:hypothetical protein
MLLQNSPSFAFQENKPTSDKHVGGVKWGLRDRGEGGIRSLDCLLTYSAVAKRFVKLTIGSMAGRQHHMFRNSATDAPGS